MIHGFGSIAPRLTTLDAGSAAAIDDDLNIRQHQRSGVALEAEAPDADPEIWTLRDRSEWGAGMDVPQGLGAWAEPGVLVI